jgi:hypothetical protein
MKAAPTLPAFAMSAVASLFGCDSVDALDEDAASCAAVEVVRFDPGDGAGYGSGRLPDVVLGPPDGGKTSEGSLDVVSLGVAGEIVLRLGCDVVDGDGVDLVVYENAFVVGSTGRAFAEPAEVAVSDDGVMFHAFPCTPPDGQVALDDGDDGCAGLAPVQANVDNGLVGVFPDGGGDGFDLQSIGVSAARFVRLRDLSVAGAAPQAGFDLDAVSARVRGYDADE